MSEPTTQPLRIGSIVTLAVALLALALSVWAVVRASSGGSQEPSYSAEQQADAKQKICAATNLVREGVSLNTNLKPAGGPRDVNGTLAVAANARVSLYSGGQYLLARLDPATPPELADAVRKFANTLVDIGAASTAGAQNSEPDQAARLREVDSLNVTITELCK
jgi:hypothetical protein